MLDKKFVVYFAFWKNTTFKDMSFIRTFRKMGVVLCTVSIHVCEAFSGFLSWIESSRNDEFCQNMDNMTYKYHEHVFFCFVMDKTVDFFKCQHIPYVNKES